LYNLYSKGAAGLSSLSLIKRKETNGQKYSAKNGIDSKRSVMGIRQPNGTCFFVVRDDDGEWMGVDDVLSDSPEIFKSRLLGSALYAQIPLSKMRKAIKSLCEKGFESLRPYQKETPTLLGWLQVCRYGDTPYPDYVRRYNHDIGLY
jgi:hypothetical protein